MERIAYWIRDNAPDGWGWPIMLIMMWCCVCIAWGAVWGFVFFDWDWIYTRGWGRFWMAFSAVYMIYAGRPRG